MSIINNSPVSSSKYNAIPLYSALASENETPELQGHVSLLTDLGSIFVGHGVEKEWGVHVLHRHFSIPDSTVVIYDVKDGDMDLCNVQPCSAVDNAVPRGLLLNEAGEWQPYEFEQAGGNDLYQSPPSAFLEAFKAFLLQHNLQNVVALSRERADDHCHTRLEYLWNNASTLSLRHVDASKPAVISKAQGSRYLGYSGWSFVRLSSGDSAILPNLLTTAVTADGIRFAVLTVASHTHKELTVAGEQQSFALANDDVACTRENARVVIKAL